MTEIETLGALMDLCYDRNYSVPEEVTLYILGRYEDLTDSITVEVPLDVCKHTSEKK